MKKLILLFFILFIGCTSVKIFDVEGQPQDCNDWYTVMDWTIKRKSDSTTLMTMQWEKCMEARESLKNRNCEIWIFQGGPIDKEDKVRYAYYTACLKN